MKYKNANEAKEHIEALELELKTLLSEELLGIDEEQRTLGYWLDMFGKLEDKETIRKQLLDLEE